MDMISIFKNANPNVVIFLVTTLIAFLSWLVKGLIEKPLNDSKITFTKYFEKRIEILTEVKTRLNFIAYFPEGDDSLEFKNELQKVLLMDGKAAYLSKHVYDNILRLSIDPVTDEVLLLGTIRIIDDELYKMISKIQDEVNFYRRFSNYNPLRRLVGITFLSLQYVLSLASLFGFLLFMTMVLLDGTIYTKIGILILGLTALYGVNKWLKK